MTSWCHHSGMRINLNTPFAEKDQAKALGARWDVARKTWYIENVEDLRPFKRWIPSITNWDEDEAAKAKKRPAKTKKPSPPSPSTAASAKSAKPKTKKSLPVTGPEAAHMHCGCNVLPWESCPHSGGEPAPCSVTPKSQ